MKEKLEILTKQFLWFKQINVKINCELPRVSCKMNTIIIIIHDWNNKFPKGRIELPAIVGCSIAASSFNLQWA